MMVYKIKQDKPKENSVGMTFATEKELNDYMQGKNNTYGIETSKESTKIPSRPQYLVEGYRWFDKVNGNTYHTVVVTDLDKNEVVYQSPYMQYGYDDQYRHTAYDELKKKGLVKEEDRFNHDLNRARFIYRVTDVNRKKDLM